MQGLLVTFTAHVTPAPPATESLTGKVQFYTNGVPLGSPVTLSVGLGAIATAQLPPGSSTMTVAYLGDGNYLGSTNSLVQVVSGDTQTPLALGIRDNGNGTVTVTFRGAAGVQYVVQATSNLRVTNAWVNVSTNTAGADGLWTYTESTAGHPLRFYRAAQAAVQTPSSLGIQKNGNGTVTATFQGTSGAQYVVQAATSLVSPITWANVSTNTAGSDGRWTFTEALAGHQQRYYRAAKP